MILAVVVIVNLLNLNVVIVILLTLPILLALLRLIERRANRYGLVLRDERDAYIDMWASSLTLKIGLIIGMIGYLIGHELGIKGLEYVFFFSMLLIFIRWILLIIGRRKF